MDQQAKTEPGRRQRNAQATRRRVLEAAQLLFVRDGYAATSIAAIAGQADVAVQTVYAVFGSKRTILTELLATGVTGDDEHGPLRQRHEWQAVEAETDPGRQLGLLAALATVIGGRMADLYAVLAAAASADPEIAGVYQRQQQARYADQSRIARSLAERGALRADLSQEHAADIIWTVANPHTYRTLVIERGWQPAQYEGWLAGVLTCSLCAVPTGQHAPS